MCFTHFSVFPQLCPNLLSLLPSLVLLLALILQWETDFSLGVGKFPMVFVILIHVLQGTQRCQFNGVGTASGGASGLCVGQSLVAGSQNSWVQGMVSLLPPASPWLAVSSCFPLAGWGSAFSTFLSLGEDLPQEMVKSERCESCSLLGCWMQQERLEADVRD